MSAVGIHALQGGEDVKRIVIVDYRELIERLRGFEVDHSPDGWPAIRMREISAMCDAIESLLAENERLKHNLTTTEQTMREYKELAAKRMEEIAKYRDAPVVAYQHRDGMLSCRLPGGGVPGIDWVLLIVKPGEDK